VAFKYSEAVPWGRSFDEYRRMFALSDQDLELRIIGCADGPASFNARMSQIGHRVVSCDPLYQLRAEQIQVRIDATCDTIIRQTRQNLDRFLWTSIKSVDELAKVRLAAMGEFLADFDNGKRTGRYVAGELPELPFTSNSFDLALCSHFLFLYSQNLSLQFHQQAIEDMCRVARETRIFPLLNYNAETSPYVEPLIEHLRNAGYNTSIEGVPYEFQRGGNKMLKVRRIVST
jgi:hypothetical protein